MSTDIEGFTRAPFTYADHTRDVYRRGSGPAVVVMTEIPGITPPVLAFAERVVAEGFTVFMPHFFGPPGKPLSVGYALGQIARVFDEEIVFDDRAGDAHGVALLEGI